MSSFMLLSSQVLCCCRPKFYVVVFPSFMLLSSQVLCCCRPKFHVVVVPSFMLSSHVLCCCRLKFYVVQLGLQQLPYWRVAIYQNVGILQPKKWISCCKLSFLSVSAFVILNYQYRMVIVVVLSIHKTVHLNILTHTSKIIYKNCKFVHKS